MSGPLSVGSALLKIVADWSGAKDQIDEFKKNTEKSMTDLKKKMVVGISAGGAAIVAGLAAAAKSAMTFGEAMANVATLGVEDLKGLEHGIMDLARTYGVDLNDAAVALYDTLSAGIPEDAAIAVLEQATRGAQAGVGSLNEALDLGTSVMNAYGLKSSDAATTTANFERVMGLAVTAVKNGKTTVAELAGSIGQVAPLANKAGVSIEELFAAIAAMTSTGSSAAESVTALKATIAGIINPTGEAEKAAAELGIEFSAAALQSKGFAGILEQVKEATGGNVDKIKELFGSQEALGVVLALTGDQATAFTKSLNDMSHAQENLTAMHEAWIKDNPQLAWDQMKATLQVLVVQIGQAVIPAFNALLKSALPILRALSEWIQAHPHLVTGIGTVVLALSTLAAAIWPVVKAYQVYKSIQVARALLASAAAADAAAVSTGGLSKALIFGAAQWVALGAAVIRTGVELIKAGAAIKGYIAGRRELREAESRAINEMGNHAKLLGEYTGMLDLAALEGLKVAEAQEVMGKAIKAVLALKQNEAIPTEQKTQEAYRQTAQVVIDTAAAEIRANQERIGWWQRLTAALGDFVSTAWQATKAYFGFGGGGGAPGMATGGMVERGGMVQVHQDELVMLPSGAEVIPRAHTPAVAAAMAGGGGGANVHVTINNPVVLDDNGLRKLRDELGRVTGYSITRAMSARGLA